LIACAAWSSDMMKTIFGRSAAAAGAATAARRPRTILIPNSSVRIDQRLPPDRPRRANLDPGPSLRCQRTRAAPIGRRERQRFLQRPLRRIAELMIRIVRRGAIGREAVEEIALAVGVAQR